jgi:hypothetical protein
MPATRDPSMLPVKRLEESHQQFMDRCMTDANMLATYPEPSQRAALCLHQAGMKPKVGGDADLDIGPENPHQIRLSGSITICQD